MFCATPQPTGRISLTLNCGLDSASVAGSDLTPIEGGVQMQTPWAFEPGAIVAIGRECTGCDRCLEPVEMLIADCEPRGGGRPGYLTTLLFLEALGTRCSEGSDAGGCGLMPS